MVSSCGIFIGVGVLFVHEIDEQMYESMLALQKKYLTCGICNLFNGWVKRHSRLIIPLLIFIVVYVYIVIWMITISQVFGYYKY